MDLLKASETHCDNDIGKENNMDHCNIDEIKNFDRKSNIDKAENIFTEEKMSCPQEIHESKDENHRLDIIDIDKKESDIVKNEKYADKGVEIHEVEIEKPDLHGIVIKENDKADIKSTLEHPASLINNNIKNCKNYFTPKEEKSLKIESLEASANPENTSSVTKSLPIEENNTEEKYLKQIIKKDIMAFKNCDLKVQLDSVNCKNNDLVKTHIKIKRRRVKQQQEHSEEICRLTVDNILSENEKRKRSVPLLYDASKFNKKVHKTFRKIHWRQREALDRLGSGKTRTFPSFFAKLHWKHREALERLKTGDIQAVPSYLAKRVNNNLLDYYLKCIKPEMNKTLRKPNKMQMEQIEKIRQQFKDVIRDCSVIVKKLNLSLPSQKIVEKPSKYLPIEKTKNYIDSKKTSLQDQSNREKLELRTRREKLEQEIAAERTTSIIMKHKSGCFKPSISVNNAPLATSASTQLTQFAHQISKSHSINGNKITSPSKSPVKLIAPANTLPYSGMHGKGSCLNTTVPELSPPLILPNSQNTQNVPVPSQSLFIKPADSATHKVPIYEIQVLDPTKSAIGNSQPQEPSNITSKIYSSMINEDGTKTYIPILLSSNPTINATTTSVATSGNVNVTTVNNSTIISNATINTKTLSAPIIIYSNPPSTVSPCFSFTSPAVSNNLSSSIPSKPNSLLKPKNTSVVSGTGPSFWVGPETNSNSQTIPTYVNSPVTKVPLSQPYEVKVQNEMTNKQYLPSPIIGGVLPTTTIVNSTSVIPIVSDPMAKFPSKTNIMTSVTKPITTVIPKTILSPPKLSPLPSTGNLISVNSSNGFLNNTSASIRTTCPSSVFLPNQGVIYSGPVNINNVSNTVSFSNAVNSNVSNVNTKLSDIKGPQLVTIPQSLVSVCNQPLTSAQFPNLSQGPVKYILVTHSAGNSSNQIPVLLPVSPCNQQSFPSVSQVLPTTTVMPPSTNLTVPLPKNVTNVAQPYSVLKTPNTSLNQHVKVNSLPTSTNNSESVFYIQHPVMGNSIKEKMKIVGRHPLHSKLNIVLTLPHHASESVLSSPKNYATQITTKTITTSLVGKKTDVKKVIIQMSSKDDVILSPTHCVDTTGKPLNPNTDPKANISNNGSNSDSWFKISSVVSISPSEWEDQSSVNINNPLGLNVNGQPIVDLHNQTSVNVSKEPDMDFTESKIRNNCLLNGNDCLDRQEEKIRILKDLLKRKNEALDRLRYIRKKI